MAFVWNGGENKTIYKGILNFPPAHFARFANGDLQIKKYWECVPCVDLNLGQDEALERLEEILGDAVRIRLRSDVAVALSVSGGVDSSILAHLANKMGAKCHYFGVNFKESNQDETKHIKQLQSDLGVEINYIAPTLENIKDDFLNLVQTQDEIFRSFSIYSQYLLFKSIAPFCKVVLGGQGADELFGGYYHHIGRYIFSNPIEFENRIKLYGNEALREYQFGLKCSLGDSLKMQLFFEDNQGGIEKLKKWAFLYLLWRIFWKDSCLILIKGCGWILLDTIFLIFCVMKIEMPWLLALKIARLLQIIVSWSLLLILILI